MIETAAAMGHAALCRRVLFTPKYKSEEWRPRRFGKVHLVKHSEKHSGPHSDWFWM